MKIIKLILVFSILVNSSFLMAQCDTFNPDEKYIGEYGNPASMGWGNSVHTLLKRTYEEFGCPIKSPKKITTYVAISIAAAKNKDLEIDESKCKLYDGGKSHCKSVIVEIKGWVYEFKGRAKPLPLWTGPGDALGIAYEVSTQLPNELVGFKINGIEVTDDFSWKKRFLD